MENWIKLQINKYAGKNFGETDNVVDKNTVAYQKLLDYVKPTMKFLDIGCNNGRISYEMDQLGLICTAIDLPEVISKSTYANITKISINLEQDFPEGTWDLIWCRETIEHIKNYEKLAQNIINAMTENSIAIITAPFDKRDFGNNCPEHHRLFSLVELKSLFQKFNIKVIEDFKEKICRSTGIIFRLKDVN